MKTRTWIILLALLFALSAALCIPLFSRDTAASQALIYSDGKLVKTLSLSMDQTFTVQTPAGSNTVTVSGGAIAVTDATCPDHYCMHRGFCSGGSSIVCLPNRLVIEFSGHQEVDMAIG